MKMDSEMINKQNNDTSLLPVKLKLEPLENILDALQQGHWPYRGQKFGNFFLCCFKYSLGNESDC